MMAPWGGWRGGAAGEGRTGARGTAGRRAAAGEYAHTGARSGGNKKGCVQQNAKLTATFDAMLLQLFGGTRATWWTHAAARATAGRAGRRDRTAAAPRVTKKKKNFFQQNGVGSCSNFSTFIGHTAARPRAPRARGVRSRGRPHRVHVAVAGWRAPGRLLGLRRLFLRIRICGGPRCVISIRGAARAAAADAPFARARGGVRGLAGREQAAHGVARAMADF